MKRFLVLNFILILTLFNFKSINATESSDFFKLPEVINQFLDTSLEGNNHVYPIEANGIYEFIDINGKLVTELKFVEHTTYDIRFYLGYTQDEEFMPNEDVYINPINGTYLIMASKVIKISDDKVHATLTDNEKYALVFDGTYEDEEYINKDFIIDIEEEKIIDMSEGNYKIIDVFDDVYIVKENDIYYIKTYTNKKLTSGFNHYLKSDDNFFIFINNDNNLYWVDKNGNIIFEYQGPCINAFFHKDIAVIIDLENKLIFMDKNKNILNTYQGFTEIHRKDNFYIANTIENEYGMKYVVFDYKGVKTVPDDYESEPQYYNPYERFFRNLPIMKETYKTYNRDKGIYDVFDKDGNIEISYKIPDEHIAIQLLNDYFILEEKRGVGLCKIVDEKIKWILEPKYEYIHGRDPFVIVSEEHGYEGLYDLEAEKFLLEPKYKDIEVYDKNMIYVRTAYFKGYMNSKGQFVYVQPVYGFGND